MSGMWSAPAGLPAGWYQDAQDAATLRFWDGAGWTVHTAPAVGDAPGTAPPEAPQFLLADAS